MGNAYEIVNQKLEGMKEEDIGKFFLKEGIRLKVGTSVAYSLGPMFALPPADRLS